MIKLFIYSSKRPRSVCTLSVCQKPSQQSPECYGEQYLLREEVGLL